MHRHNSALIGASRVHLPAGNWPTVYAFLCEHFAQVSAEQWQQRFSRGRVLDQDAQPLALDTPYQQGRRVYYFREVAKEKPVPFQADILFQNDDLLVVDKPHFLPVSPVGVYVEETLQRRLMRQLNNPQLTPIHRLDRLTAGLILFSTNSATRDAYQRLFREQQVKKRYEALAAPLPELSFPRVHCSRLVKGEPFFCMQEIAGEANSETRIEVAEKQADYWRYALYPVSGKKHQLRVHLASLGAPIINDDFYPQVLPEQVDNFSAPLQLLATDLWFTDPVTQQPLHFKTQRHLAPLVNLAN